MSRLDDIEARLTLDYDKPRSHREDDHDLRYLLKVARAAEKAMRLIGAPHPDYDYGDAAEAYATLRAALEAKP